MGPPLVVLTGCAGSGLTRALAEERRRLLADGVRVLALRFTTDGAAVAADLHLRAAVGVSAHEPEPGGARELLPGSLSGAHADPRVARRVASVVAAPLLATGTPGAALLVDDAQRAGPDAQAVLGALVPLLAGAAPDAAPRCVVALHTPVPEALRSAGAVLLRDLRAQGLVETVRRRPQRPTEIARELRAALGAAPSADLVAEVRRSTRGVRAAVSDAVADLSTGDRVRVIDRHAYPAPQPRRHDGTERDPYLVAAIRRLGPTLWDAARATAVLAPTGAGLPALLTAALDTTPERAARHLASLTAAGVLHTTPRGWRILVPDVAEALRAACRPFERRRLAALVVDAVWDGWARCPDDHLTDCIARAGGLLDHDRARRHLVDRAARATDDPTGRSARPGDAHRWWDAAAELATEHHHMAWIRRGQVFACFLEGDYAACAHWARVVLEEHADDLPLEDQRAVVLAMSGAEFFEGRRALIVEVAEAGPDECGDDAAGVACCAIALALLDRWSEVEPLIDATRDRWAGSRVARATCELLEALAGLLCGRPARFDRLVDLGTAVDREVDPYHWSQHTASLATLLLRLDDRRRVEGLLDRQGLPDAALPAQDRATLALLRGAPDGIDQGRRALARAVVGSHDSGRAATTRLVAQTMAGQGRLLGARRLIDAARREQLTHDNLLDDVEVQIDRLLGADDDAEARARIGVETSAERGIVAGTDLLWAHRVLGAVRRGDGAAARQALERLDEVERRLPTGRTAMLALLARAVIHDDRAAADGCLDLAGERGVPFDLARCRLTLIEHGVSAPSGLVEVHELWGRLGAPLHRARTRSAMTRFGIPGPGRRATTEENEALLATLVGEGLSNRAIAAVLASSEKSVEGRLGRLLARTGHRSRIALAVAVLDGDGDGDGDGVTGGPPERIPESWGESLVSDMATRLGPALGWRPAGRGGSVRR